MSISTYAHRPTYVRIRLNANKFVSLNLRLADLLGFAGKIKSGIEKGPLIEVEKGDYGN